jgi:signal transduction histidine kinase
VDGPAAEIGTGGHGLIGMRERAVGLGGWFAAEPVAGGGFLVRAGLPLD